MKQILCIFFLSLILRGYAQSYQLRYLGVEDGLSNNYVLGITLDKNGCIWFATEEGLNRFDGNKFVPYYKYSSHKLRLTGNELNCVFADRHDPVIWIGTQRAGLNAYNYEEETFVSYLSNRDDPFSLITDDVTSIDQAADGNIWIGTYHRGVDLLDKTTGIFTHFNRKTLPELASDHVWQVLDGHDGNLYIGHVDNGLTILSIKDKKLRNFRHDPDDGSSLPGNEVHALYKDNQNNLWIGTNNGLALYNPDTQDFFVFRNVPGNPNSLPSNSVFAITQYDDKLIVATEFNGVSLLDLKRPLFMSLDEIRFQNSASLSYAQRISQLTIRAIFCDSFQNLWMGTYGEGINFMAKDTSPFHTWSFAPGLRTGLTHKIAWGIVADKKGNIWVGTDGDGINQFRNGERIKTYNRENGKLDNNSVITVFEDSRGRIWVGTFYGGLFYYNPDSDRFVAVSSTAGLDIRCIYEDKKQQLWVGTHKGIYIYSLDNPVTPQIYDVNNTGLFENFIRSIQEDHSGRIWVGTFGGGLALFSPEMKKIRIYTERSGFPSNTINQILVNSMGNVMVATGNGLVEFLSGEDPDYIVYGRNEGIGNSYIRAMTEDENQELWLSTNNGISRYSRTLGQFYNYNHVIADIPIGNFMSGSVTTDKNGYIYFGSINGVCYFDPVQIEDNRYIPPVVITELTIYDKFSSTVDENNIHPVLRNQPIRLTYKENTFNVGLSIQDYALQNQVEFAYLLKGFEDAWIPVDKGHSITFRNLSPGQYELQVKARIGNQEWHDNVSTWPLRISPPIWLSWWAKTIYGVFVILIVLVLMKLYKRRLYLENSYRLERQQIEKEKELNNERLRFFTNITHELRTPLSLILGPLEDLVHEHSLPPEPLRKISVIHQSALHLLQLINQILEFRKTETQNKKLCVSQDDITSLVREIGLRYKELNTNKRVRIELIIPLEPVLIYFDREILVTILQNLLSNALKYTSEGHIKVVLRSIHTNDADYVEIEVSDTGCGIAPDALEHIYERYYQADHKHQASGTGIGLALVKNLVEIHQGTIHVESLLNKGTSFYLRLLSNNMYPQALHVDVPEQEIKQAFSVNKNTSSIFSHNPVLLVVEDNADIAGYIKDSFHSKFEVYLATNGKEGLELAFSKIPDVIISDIMMPVMDGLEFCKIIKEDMRTSHIPVILLTAKDSLSNKTEGYESGADSYITKPFSANLLRSRVSNLLESRQKLAQLVSANERSMPEVENVKQSLGKLDSIFLEKITMIIEDNLSTEKLDVAFIADKMCMSSSTLYRKLKSLTTISTNEYVRKIRIRKAAQLLREGEYNVSEITYLVGFNSVKYFRQCFKEEFGVSPSDYKGK